MYLVYRTVLVGAQWILNPMNPNLSASGRALPMRSLGISLISLPLHKTTSTNRHPQLSENTARGEHFRNFNRTGIFEWVFSP